MQAADPPAAERELCARFERSIPDRVNADPHLVWRGRTLRAACLVQIGTSAFLMRIESGSIQPLLTRLPPLTPWDLAVRGSVAAWSALWQDPPPAGWHDLFALSKRGELSIEGDLQPFLAHLQYFKDVLALPRKAGAR